MSKRGGARKKTTKENLKTLWCHDDAKAAMDAFVKHSESKFHEELQKMREQQKNISAMTDQCMDPELCEAIPVAEMPENKVTDDAVDEDPQINEEIDEGDELEAV